MADLKYVQANGDKVTWKFKVSNTSSNDCYGTKVAFTIPTGVSLTGPLVNNTTEIDVPVGSFNPTSSTWFIGNLAANTSTAVVEWEFTVDDITEANALDDSFIVTATASSRCSDSNPVDDDFELMIKVGEECLDINLSVGGQIPNSDDGSGGYQITV